ncbi:GNAT family N-acetyltransferase [Pseudonocardia sp. H11422]|uniref:GNAT family N-acetyltransferase n=1 Tax=Pseudonocardia sp. H11422 TaxID=2835866 RepID=UPI001BDC3A26|nr:GNAT family N-acetyltransferase [Pseudonocardia sp. H11422]
MTVRTRLLAAEDAHIVAPIWTGLEEHVGEGRPSISWTWTSTWLRHYGDAVAPKFVVVERQGEPIAAALLIVSRRGNPVLSPRRLHLGTAGEPSGQSVFVEYNDLLCAPEDMTAVVRALAGAINDMPGWDELDLPGFRPETAEALREAIPFEAREDASWTVRLSSSRTVLEGMTGPNRRLVRQARESLCPVEPELAADPGTADEMLAELIELHQARWTAAGRPGVFASRRLDGFLKDLIREWHPEGRALIYRLRDEAGSTIGCVVGFVEDDRFLQYQSGFQQYTENRKRAGLLCHAVFAEHCRGRGLSEYELLAGDGRFKRQLSGGERNTLVWGQYTRPSLRNRAIDAARRARDAAVELRAAAGRRGH